MKFKKTLSIILSLCMLFSVTAGLNITVYADNENVVFSKTVNSNSTEKIKYNFTVPKTGVYCFYSSGETPVKGGILIQESDSDYTEMSYWKYDSFSLDGTNFRIVCCLHENIECSIEVNNLIGDESTFNIFVEYQPEIEEYDYKILDDDSIIISEIYTNLSAIKIPDYIDGHKVTEIGYQCTLYSHNLEKISIGENILNIHDDAFRYATNLKDVEIGSNVESIGENVFIDCKNLENITVSETNNFFSSQEGVLFDKNKTEILCYPMASERTSYTIPNTVRNIKENQFNNCKNLTDVIIGNSVTSIGIQAFWGCKGLTNLEIPNGVKTIDNWAFGNTSIESIFIPKSVTKIGYGVFQQCNNLKTIIVDKNNVVYDSRDNCNAIVKTNDNAIVEACQTTVFPKTITTIEDGAFGWRATYEEITIPETITRIESQAFAHTENTLKKVTILNEKCYIDNFVYPPNSGGSQQYTFPTSVTIVGYKNSTANEYAKTHNNPFVTIKCTHNYTTNTTKATVTKNGTIKCSKCGYVKQTITYPKIITLSATVYNYDGKVKTPAVTVKDAKGKTLVKNIDYTVTYASGRKLVGKYAVKITFKGNYSGTKTLYFTIRPKTTSISSITAGSKKFTVKLKKYTTQTTGYQIQYATNSKFTSAKTVSMKNNATSKTISKLSGGKKYYVRVRTYKTVKINGKNTNIYSAWSSAKAVITKK